MSPTAPSLTVVIPVFNQANEIGETLLALDRAIGSSPFRADIVVVDDGSQDGSADAARSVPLETALRAIAQPNAGRFAARRAGLAAAAGDYCLMIDSRVRIEPSALDFVAGQLALGEAREIWNGHVEIDTDSSPYATFWDILTKRAFAAYFEAPRTTSYGLAEFDRYPKGMTCFFAPRELLLAAFDAYRSGYSDLRYANDDTPLIRSLAAQRPINISPGFSCRYASRSALRPFLRHAFHRGIVFVDGHGRRESRWFPAVVALYVGSAACILVGRREPRLLALPFATAATAGAALAVSEHRVREAPTMAWVSPLYACAHVAGMWRGLGLLVRGRLRSRR